MLEFDSEIIWTRHLFFGNLSLQIQFPYSYGATQIIYFILGELW